MTLQLHLPEKDGFKPSIAVFGIGGAGGNAVNNMIDSNLQGVNFVAANTDAQALEASRAAQQIQLGGNLTSGLGAGASPEVGSAAAEESLPEILEYLEDCNMAFITAGMGGGTGTGAAPVIARAAREKGILTVGVVTKPFHFEGAHRMRIAELGVEELQNYVDTLIVIPNQNLFRIADEKTTFADAFTMADNVLHAGVRGVTDLIVMPGLINLDFADIKTIMSEMGKAMMGTGEAEGDSRATKASEAAISNPLLDNVTMKGARGVLINITGGMDMTLFEVDEAANRIREEVENEANIIFGSTFNPDMEGKIRVSVIATGIDTEVMPGKQASRQRMTAAGFSLGSLTAKKEAIAVKQEPVVAVAETEQSSDAEEAPLELGQQEEKITFASLNAVQETAEPAIAPEKESIAAAAQIQPQYTAEAEEDDEYDDNTTQATEEDTRSTFKTGFGFFGMMAGARKTRGENIQEPQNAVKVTPTITRNDEGNNYRTAAHNTFTQPTAQQSQTSQQPAAQQPQTAQQHNETGNITIQSDASSYSNIPASASAQHEAQDNGSDVGVLERSNNAAINHGLASPISGTSQSSQDKDDMFEIPAFLRRKDEN